MGVFRVEKNKNYTVMSNAHLRDFSLSLKAKGLLSQMLSLPEDWDYTLRGLAAINKESINTISSIVNELINAGYIIREQVRGEAGHFGDINYLIFESVEDRDDYLQNESLVNGDTIPSNNINNNKIDSAEGRNSSVIQPFHKNCDTVEMPINSEVEPCHKKRDTDNRDTENCDANKILNKQNKDINNIYNNQSINHNKSNYVELYEKKVDLIKQNISYDALINDRPEDIGLIDKIVDVMLEVLLEENPNSVIRISSKDRPVGIVKSRFMKLDMLDIEYVVDCIKSTNTKILNISGYILTSLFNSKNTSSIFYQNQVNHDLIKTQENKLYNQTIERGG